MNFKAKKFQKNVKTDGNKNEKLTVRQAGTESAPHICISLPTMLFEKLQNYSQFKIRSRLRTSLRR